LHREESSPARTAETRLARDIKLRGVWNLVRHEVRWRVHARGHHAGSHRGDHGRCRGRKSQKVYEGLPFEIFIEQIEPERLFSFRWHPGAVEPGVDYSVEPTTLVAFALEELPDGVMLTVTESGFDRIPLARRAKAFAANDGGWSIQVRLIAEYLTRAQ
jgi:uncharacterized protein YndB with AHSA1/START domain